MVHVGNFLVMITFSALSVLLIKKKFDCLSKSEVSNLFSSGYANHTIDPQILSSIKTKEISTNTLISYICLTFIMNEISTLIGSVIGTYIRANGTNRLLDLFLFIILVIYITSNTVTFFIYKKFSRAFSQKLKKIFCKIRRPIC